MALDAHLPGIHGGVGLEIVEDAACSPGPGAQSAPIVEAARLASVHQADDALRKPGSIVGLKADWIENRKAPAAGQHQAAIYAPFAGGAGRRRLGKRPLKFAPEVSREGHLENDGNRSGGLGGDGEEKIDVDGNLRIDGVVDMADEAPGYGVHATVLLRSAADNFPSNGGKIVWRAAQDLAFVIGHDLRAAL